LPLDAQAAEATGAALLALDRTAAVAVGVRPAHEVCDLIGRNTFLHAGPPIEIHDVVGPARGALVGALLFEGVAADVAEAEHVLDHGLLTLLTCHEVGAVGAMSGVVSSSMPVVLVETETGARTFAPLNEGLGKALRFGSYDDDVLQRLAWMSRVAGPLLDLALQDVGGLDVTALQAEGLRRGDECHNRNVACTAATLSKLAPSIIRRASSSGDAADVCTYMAGNPHFFLSFSIAAAKAIADAAERTYDPGVVTAMGANGRSFGIRVNGLGGQWFLGDSPVGEPKLFPGFTPADVCPAIGDSYTTEAVGLGAFALSAAPALSEFVGGDPTQSSGLVAELRRICRGTSTRFLIPFEGFRGTPLGIDVRLVVETGIAPLVNNGLAHRLPGKGQVGAGLTRLPLEPFAAAARALCENRRAHGAEDSAFR
jgi:uncharacterized protein DUF1116